MVAGRSFFDVRPPRLSLICFLVLRGLWCTAGLLRWPKSFPYLGSERHPIFFVLGEAVCFPHPSCTYTTKHFLVRQHFFDQNLFGQ